MQHTPSAPTAPAKRPPPSLRSTGPVWPSPSSFPTSRPAEIQGLGQLSELIATSYSPRAGLINTARALTEQAGGARMPPGLFCAALLDLADRVGRVPPATWLALCRGLALGASIPGQGSLPLPLRHAATRLLDELPLPAPRRQAMAQALRLDGR